MKFYISKKDAERNEGMIYGIDSSIYETIDEAKMDFEGCDDDVFAYESDDGIRVAWTA